MGQRRDPMVAAARPLKQGIDALAEVLRAGLRADVCLMALGDPHSSEPRVYRAAAVYLRTGGGGSAQSRLGARLLLRPLDGPLLYNRSRSRSRSSVNRNRAAGLGSTQARQRLGKLADLLEVSSLLSFPLDSGESCIGRLYIGSKLQRYTSQDVPTIASRQ
jgi:hypothetical protein